MLDVVHIFSSEVGHLAFVILLHTILVQLHFSIVPNLLGLFSSYTPSYAVLVTIFPDPLAIVTVCIYIRHRLIRLIWFLSNVREVHNRSIRQKTFSLQVVGVTVFPINVTSFLWQLSHRCLIHDRCVKYPYSG